MALIGILGNIGSGKDTIAEYLCASAEFTRISMASALKDACAAVFGWDREMLEGKSAEHRAIREQPDMFWASRLDMPDFSPRLALQLVGTQLFRDALHQDIWVISAERKILQHQNVVISDIRFPNECEMIRRNGGQIWVVRRGPLPEWWKCAELTTSAMANDANPENFPIQWELSDKKQLMEDKYPDIHFSEWAWASEKFDRELTNDGTLVELFYQIEGVR
jgi:hypothetical protein